MDILIAYDVNTETSNGRRRLRKVANTCIGYGQRVQKSIFECTLTEVQFEQFRARLLSIINEKEDNLRMYRLPQPREQFTWTYGIQTIIDLDEPLVY